eukprot:1160277-Pelagomonas_calceolata.AAC.20
MLFCGRRKAWFDRGCVRPCSHALIVWHAAVFFFCFTGIMGMCFEPTNLCSCTSAPACSDMPKDMRHIAVSCFGAYVCCPAP